MQIGGMLPPSVLVEKRMTEPEPEQPDDGTTIPDEANDTVPESTDPAFEEEEKA